jgi:hypothetical protein
MNEKVKEYKYSDDEFIIKAIKYIKEGNTEEEVRKKFNLSDDDMDLFDFVINEF